MRMTEDPVFCVRVLGDTVRRAAELMRSPDVGIIPVVADAASRDLAGVITDRDLVVRVVAEARDANAVVVGAVMTAAPAANRPEDDIEKAMQLMEAKRVRRRGTPVSIIAQADVAAPRAARGQDRRGRRGDLAAEPRIS